jgi:hypothetical protein
VLMQHVKGLLPAAQAHPAQERAALCTAWAAGDTDWDASPDPEGRPGVLQ